MSLIVLLKLFNILWCLFLILLGCVFFVGNRVADHFKVQMLRENVLHQIDTHKTETLLFIWVVQIDSSKNQYLADSILLLTIKRVNRAAELVFDV